MDYGDIFKRGFLHTWNNKFLYMLGFLAALGGSAGGRNINLNFPGNFNPGGVSSSGGNVDQVFEDLAKQFGLGSGNFGAMLAGLFGAIFAIVCVLVMIKVVLWFVRLIAEAGMIQAVSDLETGVKTNFKKAFADGRPFMMRFFMVNLITYGAPILIMLLAIGFVAVPLSFSNGNFEEGIFLWFIPIICLGCLFIPYNIFISLIYPIAQRGIIFKGMEAMESLKHGWDVLKRQPAEILLLALMYVVVGVMIGIVSAIAFVPILLGSGWPVISAFMNDSVPSVGAFSLLGVGFLIAIIVSAIINAVFVSFRSATFTLAYLQLEGKVVETIIEEF